MHNAAFMELGLDCVYLPFKVHSQDLGKAIQGMRGLNIRGLNVTIPHKVAVMTLLDDVDDSARNLGAVNTITSDGGLKGYNTDAIGFLNSLAARKIEPADKKIVVLGAGGAARAVALILMDRGAHLTIVNRHLPAAQALAGRLTGMYRRDIQTLEFTADNLKEALGEADLVVNTTPVGMFPAIDYSPIPYRWLKKKLVVFDIIYNPIKTRLLQDAERRGAVVISGVEMLVGQGAAAFELWTGKKAPVEAMRAAVVEALTP